MIILIVVRCSGVCNQIFYHEQYVVLYIGKYTLLMEISHACVRCRAQPKSEIWRGRERMVCLAQGVLLAHRGCGASQDHQERLGNVASLDSL